MAKIREPVQKRSIETKKKIVDAAFKVFSDVGYFSTNTVEIAKAAGVSTGIIYGYFKNKRDIMLDVLEVYIDKVYSPIMDLFDSIPATSTLETTLTLLLDTVVQAHIDNASIHETLNSLTHSDELVAERFDLLEDDVTKKIVNKFIERGFVFDDLYERVHVAMNEVQSYSHEVTFANHDYINFDKMRRVVISVLVGLFTKQ